MKAAAKRAKKKPASEEPVPSMSEVMSEAEYMARHDREVAQSRYWATYNIVLRVLLPQFVAAEYGGDKLDVELERAHNQAKAAAERAHGTLAEIRR